MVPADDIPPDDAERKDDESGLYWSKEFDSDSGSQERQSKIDPLWSPKQYLDRFHRERLKESEQQLIHHSPGRSELQQSTRKAQREKVEIAGDLCDQLGVAGIAKLQAQALMLAFDLSAFGHHKKIEKVALATIRFAVEQNLNAEDDEYNTRMTDHDGFRKLLTEEDMDLGDLMRISNIVKEQVKALRGQ